MIATTAIDGDVDNIGEENAYIFSRDKDEGISWWNRFDDFCFSRPRVHTVTAPLLLSKLPKHMQPLQSILILSLFLWVFLPLPPRFSYTTSITTSSNASPATTASTATAATSTTAASTATSTAGDRSRSIKIEVSPSDYLCLPADLEGIVVMIELMITNSFTNINKYIYWYSNHKHDYEF